MPALRDWGTFCPRRYDLTLAQRQRGPGGTLLLDAGSGHSSLPQAHNWRQELGVLTITPDGVDGATAVHVLGAAGFFCTRCIMGRDEQGRITRFTGDAEESEAMRALIAQQQATV